jgi:alpha-mannosidase
MQSAGIKYFLTQKLSWNLINKFPHTTFVWEGIDGSSVLTHFPPADTYNSSGSLDQVCKSITNNKDLDRVNESLMLFGHGDGGGGPKLGMLEMLTRMQNLDGIPQVKFQSVHAFFQSLESSSRDLSKWSGELYLELHRGTYTSQATIKKSNRKSEIALRDSEILSSVAALVSSQKELDSSVYPLETINSLWKLVMLNQFHDVLPGTSIEMVYQDSRTHYATVQQQTEEIIQNALQTITGKLSKGPSKDHQKAQPTKENSSLLLFNTLSWPRLILTETEQPFNESPSQKIQDSERFLQLVEITGMSAVVLNDSVSSPTFAEVKLTEEAEFVVLENAFVRVSLGKDGRIYHLLHLESNRDAISPGKPANNFVLFDDVPFFWDAWDIMVYHLETRKELLLLTDLSQVKFEILERGPLRASVQVTLPISSQSWISQKISLELHSPIVRFDSEVEWNESRKLLKVEFPSTIRNSFANYEIQYGHIPRPTHYNTSWDLAKFEVCGHKWVDFSEFDFGLSILNDCKYSHSVHDNVISLTLLKSPKAPDANCDVGRHQFSYGMMVHTKTFQESQVIQRAYEFNCPVRKSEIPQNSLMIRPSTPLFELSRQNVILEAVKLSEQKNAIILRFYEAFGGSCSVEFRSSIRFRSAYLCNILEDEITELCCSFIGETTIITLEFSKFEIKTLKLSCN